MEREKNKNFKQMKTERFAVCIRIRNRVSGGCSEVNDRAPRKMEEYVTRQTVHVFSVTIDTWLLSLGLVYFVFVK